MQEDICENSYLGDDIQIILGRTIMANKLTFSLDSIATSTSEESKTKSSIQRLTFSTLLGQQPTAKAVASCDIFVDGQGAFVVESKIFTVYTIDILYVLCYTCDIIEKRSES